MSAKHTAEPWVNGNARLINEDSNLYLNYGHYKCHLGRIITIGEKDDKIAERISVCVNACAGMDDPERHIEQWRILETYWRDKYTEELEAKEKLELQLNAIQNRNIWQRIRAVFTK